MTPTWDCVFGWLLCLSAFVRDIYKHFYQNSSIRFFENYLKTRFLGSERNSSVWWGLHERATAPRSPQNPSSRSSDPESRWWSGGWDSRIFSEFHDFVCLLESIGCTCNKFESNSSIRFLSNCLKTRFLGLERVSSVWWGLHKRATAPRWLPNSPAPGPWSQTLPGGWDQAIKGVYCIFGWFLCLSAFVRDI